MFSREVLGVLCDPERQRLLDDLIEGVLIVSLDSFHGRAPRLDEPHQKILKRRAPHFEVFVGAEAESSQVEARSLPAPPHGSHEEGILYLPRGAIALLNNLHQEIK